jgi:diguanylate cyclase (GGDEF)-like protein
MGEVVLRHELERAERSAGHLVCGYADVDGLKALNDSEGHAMGDTLLVDAVAAIRSKLRPYDPVVRWGGDEFVCAFSEDVGDTGTHRLAEMEVALREIRPGASMTIGLATLRGGDSLEALMERADGALRGQKARRRVGRDLQEESTSVVSASGAS